MSYLAVYLAKSRLGYQRAHFGIFIPNEEYNSASLGETFKTEICIGTIIHVVGEPMIVGFSQEFKRNFNCTESSDLKELVLLGNMLDTHVYKPHQSDPLIERTPRCQLENMAMRVLPPPRGQDIRAPIDGVS
ncbi:hypothetical protein LIA77_03667 [Sarocladium implicatum]|nr:hypothetical protein LIA77_03667 [Sarocladium implicatum]